METQVQEYEIKTEYKLIREITITFVTVGGVERKWDTHRGGQVVPGALIDDVYTPTDVSGMSQGIQDIASGAWTEDIHTAYEAKLRT